MSEPLTDAQLAAIRERVPSLVCPAAHPAEADKSHVWVTGSLSGTNRCSACHLSQRALDSDEAVLLREVDRLRAQIDAAIVLHERGEHDGMAICLHCSSLSFPPPETGGIWSDTAYPCQTLQALGVAIDPPSQEAGQ